MAIKRFAKKGGFTTIDNKFLEDPSLTARAKGIQAYLLTRPDNWDVNVEQIISVMKEGREAITTAIKELEQAGYIKRSPIYNPDTFRITGWTKDVIERPVPEEITPIPKRGRPPKKSKESTSDQVSQKPVKLQSRKMAKQENGKAGKLESSKMAEQENGNLGHIINTDSTITELTKTDPTITFSTNACANGEREKKFVPSMSKSLKPEEEEDAWGWGQSIEPEVAKHSSLGEQTQEPKVSQEVEILVETKSSAAAPPRVSINDNVKHATETPRTTFRDTLKYDRDKQEKIWQEVCQKGMQVYLPDLRNLADYIMGDTIAKYRQSGVLQWPTPGDVNEGFLKFLTQNESHYIKNSNHALTQLQNWERDPLNGWTRITRRVDQWQEFLANPHQAVSDAMSRAGTKNATELDKQISRQALIATQKPQEGASTPRELSKDEQRHLANLQMIKRSRAMQEKYAVETPRRGVST